MGPVRNIISNINRVGGIKKNNLSTSWNRVWLCHSTQTEVSKHGYVSNCHTHHSLKFLRIMCIFIKRPLFFFLSLFWWKYINSNVVFYGQLIQAKAPVPRPLKVCSYTRTALFWTPQLNCWVVDPCPIDDQLGLICTPCIPSTHALFRNFVYKFTSQTVLIVSCS